VVSDRKYSSNSVHTIYSRSNNIRDNKKIKKNRESVTGHAQGNMSHKTGRADGSL